MIPPEFQLRADAALKSLLRWLEPACDRGEIEDVTLQDGVLTITPGPGIAAVVVNSHRASQQIWLAARPIGGLHFRYDEARGDWRLPDGRELVATLAATLADYGITLQVAS